MALSVILEQYRVKMCGEPSICLVIMVSLHPLSIKSSPQLCLVKILVFFPFRSEKNWVLHSNNEKLHFLYIVEGCYTSESDPVKVLSMNMKNLKIYNKLHGSKGKVYLSLDATQMNLVNVL